MSKVKFFRNAALIVVIAALVLTGLPAAKAADPVEIKVWLLTDRQAEYEKLIADFNAAQKDIKVKGEFKATDVIKESLRQVLNTDAAPDVFFNWGASGLGLGGYYIRAGGVEPIQKYFDKYKWGDRFSKAEVAASTLDGKLWAMPFRIRTMGLFYLKETFKKAGIDKEPATYEELQAANDKLVKAGVVPLQTAGKFGWMPMRLTDSLLELKCGAQKHDALKDMTGNWATEPCATEAFTELQTWAKKGWLPKDFLGLNPDAPQEVHGPVYKGESAYYYEGDWIVPNLDGEGVKQDELGFFYFPTNNKRVSFFTEQLFITSNSKHKDEAAAFLDYVSSADVQKKYQSVWGSLSPTLGLKPATEAGVLIAEINDLLKQAEGVYIPTDQSLPLDVVNTLFRVDADIVQNVIQPKEAAAKMQEAIDMYMKTQKK